MKKKLLKILIILKISSIFVKQLENSSVGRATP